MIEPERLRPLNDLPVNPAGRRVVYWMQQSQRAEGNPALEHAVARANGMDRPLDVVFGLTDGYPEANARHYAFMLQGLAATRDALAARGIGFELHLGDPAVVAAEAARDAALVVADRGYMPVQVRWRASLAREARVRVEEVEGDVVVPVAVASDKEEFAARTIRPRIHRHWRRFLVPLKTVELRRRLRAGPRRDGEIWRDADDLLARLKVDRSVTPADGFAGGTPEARRRLKRFVDHKLAHYAELRNDPTMDYQSGLSPYLHFGQISAVEVARAADASGAPRVAVDAFLEELVVRRELSMNFAAYNPACETYAALPAWARQTLADHAADPRAYTYGFGQWEAAATHDAYWNAAQREMVRTGKMHNYMRMYWGKKILEWSRTPEEAFDTALRLNNRYELDGRDPNSSAGVAWCFGKHDRPWTRRPVFGTVRYMNAAGLDRKFDMADYVARFPPG
jgi:deoxyribodipyrimidine photo-lyase